MKKTVSIILTLVMLLTAALAVIPASAAVLPNENWTASDDGVYRIATASDLLAFGSFASVEGYYEGKTVLLTADIDMTGIEWFRVDDFKGTLDGQGHAIKGLTMTGASDVAMFRKITNATIKNLRVIDGSITATGSTASVFAIYLMNEVKFENVYTKMTVKIGDGTNSRVSGFAAMIGQGAANAYYKAIFNGCVSECTIIGGQRGAGFIAQTQLYTHSEYNDCAFIGDLSGAQERSAAFTAHVIASDVTLTRCVSMGKACKRTESGIFVYLDHNANETAMAMESKIVLNDCYAAAAADRFAIGTQKDNDQGTGRSYGYTVTVNYGGQEVLKATSSATSTIYSQRAVVDNAVKYFAKGTTVTLTKDNFKTNYTALSADDKWVAVDNETVTYADDLTVLKVLPAAAKALIEAPFGNQNNNNDSENTTPEDNKSDDNKPEETEPDASETTDTETAAETTAAPSETEAEDNGCGGFVGMSAIAVIAIAGAAAITTRKRED